MNPAKEWVAHKHKLEKTAKLCKLVASSSELVLSHIPVRSFRIHKDISQQTEIKSCVSSFVVKVILQMIMPIENTGNILQLQIFILSVSLFIYFRGFLLVSAGCIVWAAYCSSGSKTSSSSSISTLLWIVSSPSTAHASSRNRKFQSGSPLGSISCGMPYYLKRIPPLSKFN